MVDNELPYSSFSVSGDFDKDGDMDVISFEKASHNIHFNENNASGPGVFSRKPVLISIASVAVNPIMRWSPTWIRMAIWTSLFPFSQAVKSFGSRTTKPELTLVR